MASLPADDPSRGAAGWRGRETILLYVAYILGAWGINGIGSILLPLQQEFGVGRSDVAFYPTLYSTGMFVIGTVGAPVVRRLGEHRTVLVAMVMTAIGVGLMAVPSRWVIGVGAVVFGIAGAMVTLMLPLRFMTLHGKRSGRAMTEANAVGSVGAVLAPLVIALTLTAGLNWRLGYVLPILTLAGVVLAAFLVLIRSGTAEEAAAPARVPAGSGPGSGSGSGSDGIEPATALLHHSEGLPVRALLGRWVDIPLAVGTEFALVFWAAAAIVEWHGEDPATATLAGSAFLVGMAVGRILGGPLIEKYRPRTLVLLGASTALAGFLLFWAALSLPTAVVGTFVAGLGVAVLYPASITRLVAADPWNRERASQMGALGLGLAVALVPVVLAGIAEWVGMRWAYTLVPVMLIAMLLKNLRPGRGDEQWEDLGPEETSEIVEAVLDDAPSDGRDDRRSL